MKKILFAIFFILIGVLILTPLIFDKRSVFAQEDDCCQSAGEGQLEINFFYSETCPHCLAEQKFLDKIENKYPEVKIIRHPVSQAHCREILVDLCTKYDIEKYLGLVPITFVGEEFFLGFDNEDGIGKKIEQSIERQLKDLEPAPEKDKNKVHLPIIGNIDLSKYSLFAQSFILGFFDGFNVCSLGALILILGLVLILRSRTKILIFGGLYILVTAIIYGLLIFLWYQLFYYLAPVLKIMNILVGILGIAGGIYFLKQFIKYKKYGPACDSKQNGVVAKFSSKIQKTFQESGGIWGLIIGVFIFAAVITIVEFPCSAVIPVLFAGILANTGISTIAYIFYILVYIFFYILDEIIIFAIALLTMNIKIASSRVMTWLSLIEAIVLFGLGVYYLAGVF